MLNNNFNELVKKYESYNSKRREKKLLYLLGLTALLAAGFFFITNSEFITKSFQKLTPESEGTAQVVTKEVKEKVVVKEPTKEIELKETKKIEKVEVKEPKRTKVATPKSENLPNKLYKRDTKDVKSNNKFQLEVKERKNLYELLMKDKDDNSYSSAVNIARFYYNENNYEKAVTWAVKASKKDPSRSLAWIIYAKSKVKEGKSKVAKKALSIYLKHTESKEVRDLLDSL